MYRNKFPAAYRCFFKGIKEIIMGSLRMKEFLDSTLVKSLKI